MITVTDKAASEIKRILSEQDLGEKVYLRLRILGGGCSGFKNKLDLDNGPIDEKTDETFVSNGIDVVIDKRSGLYLEGAIVDYSSDLNKMGFIVTNSNFKNTCGCGSSWSM